MLSLREAPHQAVRALSRGSRFSNKEDEIFAKCAWRLVPFMALLYVVNILDRVNVGFAALTMNHDLGLSPADYGFGAGLFFIGYVLFDIPSSVALVHVGARRWIFRIMVSWGVISMTTAFARGPSSFYILRFLLGVAEAGFAAGMLLYLTYWFPKSYRARFMASFVGAVPFAGVIGGPLSSVILGMDGLLGLRGWQWMFLIEGLPACLFGIAVLKLLPDRPSFASWLSPDEKQIISARLASEDSAECHNVWSGLRDYRVLALCLALLGVGFARFGISLWLPQIVRGMGFSNIATGYIVSLPYVAAVGATILWGRSSDCRNERILHVAIPALAAASGCALASVAGDGLLLLAMLALAVVGIEALSGTFFSLPTSFLGGTAAASGIALISATGQTGAFFGSSVMGVIKEQTGDYTLGMMVMAAGLVQTAVVVLALGRAMASRTATLQPKVGKT